MADPNVTSEQDILNYHKYLLSQGKSPQEAGEYSDYLRSQLSAGNLSTKLGEVGTRVLSIPGATGKALTLGTAAKLKTAITGEKDESDYLRELVGSVTGKGVPSAEYLKRLGFGAGADLPAWMTRKYKTPTYDLPQGGTESLPSYTKEGAGNVRDVLGGAVDVGADVIAGLGLAKGLKAAGKGLHGLAYDVPEANFRMENKAGIGPKQVAFESGIDRPQDILPELKRTAQARASEYGKVTDTGTRIDINKAMEIPESKARAMANSRDRDIRAEGQMALDEINRIKEDYGPKYSSQGRPETVLRKSEFIPKSVQEPITDFNVPVEQTTMPGPKPGPRITYDPLSKTRTKNPLPPKTVKQTRTFFYPDDIVEYDKFTGKPIYRRDVRPEVAYTAPETPEDILNLRRQIPFETDVRTGLPVKQITEGPRIPGKKSVPFTPAASVEEASNLKTKLWEETPKSEWNVFKKSSSGKDLSQSMAGGLKKEIERAAEESVSGSGKNIAAQNEKMAALYSLAEQATPEVLKEARRNKLFTSVDAPLAILSPGAAGVKKFADILKMPRVKTFLGRKMYNLGAAGETAYPMTGGLDMNGRNILNLYNEEN